MPSGGNKVHPEALGAQSKGSGAARKDIVDTEQPVQGPDALDAKTAAPQDSAKTAEARTRMSFPRMSVSHSVRSPAMASIAGAALSKPGQGVSGAWSTVQRVMAQQSKEKKKTPKILSIFRDKQRQLSVKKARAGCLKGLVDLRNKIQVIMLSTGFNGFLTVLIIANAVMVGFVVDYQAQCLLSESEISCLVFESDKPAGTSTFEHFEMMYQLNVADIVFTVIFGVELLTKLFGFGRDFWKFAWNIFDFLIISVSVVEAGVSLSISSFVQSDHFALLSIVPVLRTLRVLRVLRVLRLVNMFVDLSILVKSAAYSARPAGWVIFLGSLFTYIFAILTTRLFGQADPSEVVNHEQLTEWFGTVPRSMYSMFQIMTLESWSMGIVRVVMQDFPYAPILFITWIVIMTIGVLNLLAAVFVNSYMHCSQTVANEIRSSGNESNLTKLQQLKKLLRCETDGYLSQEDFINRIRDSYDVAHALQDLVSTERVAKAFQCINMEETQGKASFDDLFQIALSLDDSATKEDINHTWLLLAHYICAMGSKIEHIHRVVSDVQAVRTAAATSASMKSQLKRDQAVRLVRQATELLLTWLPDNGAKLLRSSINIVQTGDSLDAGSQVDWVKHPHLVDRLSDHLLSSSFQEVAGQPGHRRNSSSDEMAGPAGFEFFRRASNAPIFSQHSMQEK